MSTKQCTACAGSGEVNALVNRGGDCTFERVTCSRCGGSGWMTDEQIAALQEGERRRLDRIAANQTIRERAAEMGVHPTVLSDMEHGRRPWPEEVKGQ